MGQAIGCGEGRDVLPSGGSTVRVRLFRLHESLLAESHILQRLLQLASCSVPSPDFESADMGTSPEKLFTNIEGLAQFILTQTNCIEESLTSRHSSLVLRSYPTADSAQESTDHQKEMEEKVIGFRPHPSSQETKDKCLASIDEKLASLFAIVQESQTPAQLEQLNMSSIAEKVSSVQLLVTSETRSLNELLNQLLHKFSALSQRLPKSSSYVDPQTLMTQNFEEAGMLKLAQEKVKWLLEVLPEVVAWVESKLSILELYDSRIARLSRSMSDAQNPRKASDKS